MMGRLLLLATLAGCDRDNTAALVDPPGDIPTVLTLPRVEVLSEDAFAEYEDAQANGEHWGFCGNPASDAVEGEASTRCVFEQLAPTTGQSRGGATFTFKGTGERVCIVIDPETVFWNQSVATSGRNDLYSYPDYLADDGDLDLFAGLSSYYTGSPGLEIGGFMQVYTDSAGRQIEIEYGECFQRGSSLSGIENAHAGRGTAEFCEINTAEREGVEYTVVLETFAVPLDDGVLSFGAMVVEGRCNSVGVNECTMLGESIRTDGNLAACTDRLELAFCESRMREFCCANPEMCGEEAPDDACPEFEEPGARDTFCAENPALCCDAG
jgi:hypothetical protein